MRAAIPELTIIVEPLTDMLELVNQNAGKTNKGAEAKIYPARVD